MINMITLSKDNPTHIVNAVNAFTEIKAINASLLNGEYDPEIRPFIKLRLFNSSTVFTLNMNLIPGSNKFNCYDILQAVSQVKNLENASFNMLTIEVPHNTFLTNFSIQLQIGVENV